MRDNGAIETRPALFGLSLSSSGRLGSRDRFGDQAQLRDTALLAVGEQADAQKRRSAPVLLPRTPGSEDDGRSRAQAAGSAQA